VTLVSDTPLGGDCTFSGCVPSKTLLSAARRGLAFSDAITEVHRVVTAIAARESVDVLRTEGVDVVIGRGVFVDATSLDVEGMILRAERIIVATGAAPLVPPIPGLERTSILTNENVFNLTELPPRLAILGGGPIGVEMAEAFARLGSAVTVVEAATRILPREELESSEVIATYLEQLGVSLRTGKTCTSVSSSGRASRLELDSGPPLEVDALLVAVGRRPSSGDFGLERAGVTLDVRGIVVVDARLRTSSSHIYAAGDVSQSLHFTHVADETGRIAAGNALSRIAMRRFHPEWIPMVTYTGLEVARVGVVEQQAPKGSRVAYLPLSEFDRALTSGDDRGFVKIIVAPRRISGNVAGGKIVGATIVASRAGEMLQEIVLAMRSGMWPARIATATHAYPSWSLAVQQTAAQFFGQFGGRIARSAVSVE
jgi:pyruvate/2-oxoglutarate dehydrogenase complex dihydrolipoamide dehydrogenase (E3) component